MFSGRLFTKKRRIENTEILTNIQLNRDFFQRVFRLTDHDLSFQKLKFFTSLRANNKIENLKHY